MLQVITIYYLFVSYFITTDLIMIYPKWTFDIFYEFFFFLREAVTVAGSLA